MDVRDVDVKRFLEKNPDFPIDYFVSLKIDSTKLNWKNYNLNLARANSWDSIPKYPIHTRMTRFYCNISQKDFDSLNNTKSYDQIIIRVKPGWSRKKMDKVADQQWKEYLGAFRKEDKIYLLDFKTHLFTSI